MRNMLKMPFCAKRDNFIGAVTAPIELVQYGDFQCRHSGNVYVAIKLLQQYLGGQLKYIYRHFPLPTVHPLALDAAVASEAAAQQGKFWLMHDIIFEQQKYLVRSSFSRFAEAIELNTTVFENSRGYKKLIHKVINDFESGVKSGVDGTPTFFINGQRYNGPDDFDSLYRTCKYAITFTDAIF
ncbi:MAG: thioredoxin domain-containing protein [Ferruginibacter sp.]